MVGIGGAAHLLPVYLTTGRRKEWDKKFCLNEFLRGPCRGFERRNWELGGESWLFDE